MKVEYINPFIESVYDLFSTMLGCRAQRGSVALATPGGASREITALIGLSGRARGTIALSFPEPTALAMVGRLLGMEMETVDETISDALGEMVNIVAGGAKAKFTTENGETPIDLSLPNVVWGNNYHVDYPSQTTWLEVPFSSELGSFNMRVTFEMDRKGE